MSRQPSVGVLGRGGRDSSACVCHARHRWCGCIVRHRTHVQVDPQATGDDGSTTEYLNGLGTDEKLRQTGAAGTIYYTADHLGSTTALTDTTGNVVERLTYDSFGNTTGSQLTRYTYTGREWDADTGLYYYRARWYDAQAGRFISEDPVGFEGGTNWYAYVLNSPLRWKDPTGTDVWLSAEAGGGAQVIYGLNGAVGLTMNIFTGEVCLYVKACIRIGAGVIASAGVKGGATVAGVRSFITPRCGKDISGLSAELTGELATPAGGGSGSIGYDGGSVGVGGGFGPSWGVGFSLSADFCYTQMLYCFNSPKNCNKCNK